MIRNSQEYGELIRQARKERGWSQAELAKHLGLCPAWVCSLETGRLKTVLENYHSKLVHILGLPEHRTDRNLDYIPPKEKKGKAGIDLAGESSPSGESHRSDKNESLEERENERAQKIILSVEGPWEIPHEKCPGGFRLLPRSHGGRREKVLSEKGMSRSLQGAKGVYIFAIEVDGSYVPIYVGKAVKQGFAKECFTDRNQHLYKEGLADHERGTPVMFFIVAPKKRGAANGKVIGDIEKVLITVAWLKNPDLVNKQYARRNWSINGVTGNGRAQSSEAAWALLDTLTLTKMSRY